MRPRAMKLLAEYLRADAEVANVIGRRVVVETPDNTDLPWVRMTQIDAPQNANSRADVHVGYAMQLDCYAGIDGGEPEAEQLQIAVCDALVRIDADDDQDGWDVSAGRDINARWLPDILFKPARARFVVTGTVYARSLEVAS